jgi:hypothetical protein
MIKNVSDLFKGLMDEERKSLDDYSLRHAPTIGKMYEGLAADILSRAFPESLGLHLRSGVIHNGLGQQTGEIDCMLVRSEGEQIPYTDSNKCHIKDVIAVFEIKKNLYSNELKDAFGHLRGVFENYSEYIQSSGSDDSFNINSARKAFSEITGLVPPPHKEAGKLPKEMEVIYHTLVIEQTSPIRIIFGYHGYKSEEGLRKGLLDFLEENIFEQGFGVGSFPQLIVGGGYSLIKINGFPYSAPMKSEYWDFYASSHANPILLILELIWTRLSHDVSFEGLWGEDLVIENFPGLLSGKLIQQADKLGWQYKAKSIKEKLLEEIDSEEEWNPEFVDDTQFVIFNMLCNDVEIKIDDKEFLEILNDRGEELEKFISSLLQTGLVALNEKQLQLITIECGCVMLPDGKNAVAENNTGRLTRWVEKISKGKQ